MNSLNKTTVIVVLLLVATNIFWWFGYQSKNKELTQAQSELADVGENKKILAFQKMFVDKVLNASGVVDFNTRVELQNAVTSIDDQDITKTWNGFLAAKTESEGQNKLKELLSLLATKVYRE